MCCRGDYFLAAPFALLDTDLGQARSQQRSNSILKYIELTIHLWTYAVSEPDRLSK